MTHYNYSGKTGEYLSSETTDESPREKGVFLLPKNATFTKPPKADDVQVAVWDGKVWSLLPDYRGTRYWLTEDYDNKEGRLMIAIGILPEGSQDTRPDAPEDVVREREVSKKVTELPDKLSAQFKKLQKDDRKKWYKNGTKTAIREALQDGELEIARDILSEATPKGADEVDARVIMLALLDELL